LASAVAWMTDSKSGQALARLVGERGPQMAAVALLLLLALDSALILTHVFDQPAALPPPGASPPASAVRSGLSPELQLAVILNTHLFGASNVTMNGEARETTMPLILSGVIADNDPRKGRAIIGQNATAAKLYAVGGAITGGASLHEVYADHVILERNGTLETLRLPRNLQVSAGPPRAASPPARPAAAANPSLLAGMVRVQPVFSQGKLTGYRIFPGGNKGNSAFSQLGLKPGDLIEAVNGTTLDDAGRAMEVLQTLSSSASATVTVSRNGQSQEVNLNMAALNVEPDADAGAATGSDASPTAPTPGGAPPMPVTRPGHGGNGNMGAVPGPAAPTPGSMSAAPGGADAANIPDRER
jgi:general secretion pathway protein C